MELTEVDVIDISWQELAELIGYEDAPDAAAIEVETVMNQPRDRRLQIVVRQGLERVPDQWRGKRRIAII